MANGPIMRFVDPDNTATIRLDLRTSTGWYVGEGTDIGRPNVIRKTLAQDGVDGAEVAATWHEGLVSMAFELILRPQANAAAMETLVNALNTELLRTKNGIEYLPHGLTGTTWILDTVRSQPIVLQEGDGYSPYVRPQNAHMVNFTIDRQPVVRGRSATLA